MKLLPCLARPQTETTPSGPFTICKAATASGSILNLPLSSQYTSRKGRAWPPVPFLLLNVYCGRLLWTTMGSGSSGSGSASSGFCCFVGVKNPNLDIILTSCWNPPEHFWWTPQWGKTPDNPLKTFLSIQVYSDPLGLINSCFGPPAKCIMRGKTRHAYKESGRWSPVNYTWQKRTVCTPEKHQAHYESGLQGSGRFELLLCARINTITRVNLN